MEKTQVFFNQKKGKSSSLINRLNEVVDKRKNTAYILQVVTFLIRAN